MMKFEQCVFKLASSSSYSTLIFKAVKLV